jgi:predicted nuclease of predicted toxin-antitoxin system
VPYALVHALLAAGVNVDTTQDRGLNQADDEVIAELTISEQRLLLTNDTDFLRLSAEACLTGKTFPPVVLWPRSGRRTV